MKNFLNDIFSLCKIMESSTFDDIDEKILFEFENKVDIILTNVDSYVSEISENDMLVLCHYASVLDMEYEDFARMLFDIIWESKYYPNDKIWRVEPFSDLLQEIKLSMQTKNNNDFSELYIPFSFGNFDMNDMNNIQIVLNSTDKYDRCDIDNVILSLLFICYEGDYPDNFEDNLLKSIIRSKWTCEYYSAGVYEGYCEDLGLGKLYKYLTNEEMPEGNSFRTRSLSKNMKSKNLFSKFSPHSIISKIMFIIKKPEKP